MSPPYVAIQGIPPELADDPPAFAALCDKLRVDAEARAGQKLPPGENREVLYGFINFDADPPSWIPCARDKANIAHLRITFTDGKL